MTTTPNDPLRTLLEGAPTAEVRSGVAHPATTRLVAEPEPIRDVRKIDQTQLHQHLDRLVGDSVEQTLNALLDAEADQLCGAKRYLSLTPLRSHFGRKVADLSSERRMVVTAGMW